MTISKVLSDGKLHTQTPIYSVLSTAPAALLPPDTDFQLFTAHYWERWLQDVRNKAEKHIVPWWTFSRWPT